MSLKYSDAVMTALRHVASGEPTQGGRSYATLRRNKLIRTVVDRLETRVGPTGCSYQIEHSHDELTDAGRKLLDT